MAIQDYVCRHCHSRVWSNDRDVAARTRAQAGICAYCDRAAAEDVRVYFGAVVRREAARVAQAEALPSALGFVLAALVGLAAVCAFVAPAAVEALVVGAIAAGIFWFSQLLGRFLA